jgi:hypothetical protein
MIYVKLRSGYLPATATNKRSRVADRLAEDLIKKYEEEKLLGNYLVTKLVSYTKKNVM